MGDSTMKHVASQRTRTAELNARGYRVLRFWNNDVLSNVEGVMETIAAAVRDAGPPPPTPPRHASHGGRGEARVQRVRSTTNDQGSTQTGSSSGESAQARP